MNGSDPRVAFWSQRNVWPSDSLTHIFLGRVVDLMGPRVFGSEWTGHESSTALIMPLPKELFASIAPAHLYRGCQILFEIDESYRSRCPLLASDLNVWPMPCQSEWDRAVANCQALSAESHKALSRHEGVCLRLANAFRYGLIHTAVRNFEGGPETPQEAWLWNTENFWWRFDTCQVNALEPFKPEPIPPGNPYIFVERASLERTLAQAASTATPASVPPVEAGEYFSPYLRCMIATSRNLGLSPRDTRKKVELIDQLLAHWPADAEKPSNEDLKSMATFLREPEFKLGRGRKRSE